MNVRREIEIMTPVIIVHNCHSCKQKNIPIHKVNGSQYCDDCYARYCNDSSDELEHEQSEKIAIDLVKLIEQVSEQVQGSDERSLLNQFLERNANIPQIVTVRIKK